MRTLLLPSVQISNTLRTLAPDFFKMDVPRASNTAHSAPIPDGKPLRRALDAPAESEIWGSNVDMCLGLWQLTARY